MKPPALASTPVAGALAPHAAHGFHATIEANPAANRVVKRLRHDVAGGVQAAAAGEYERLERFTTALAGHPHLRCPTPIELDAHAGAITMTWCTGRPIGQILADPSATPIDTDHVVDQIIAGLETYVATFAEPHPDFTLANILYDPVTRIASFVDLTPVEIGSADRRTPFEVSLGFLVAVASYETVRPATWWNVAFGRRVDHLSARLLRRLAERHRLRPDLVRRVADARFDILRGFGSPLRRLWYATVGGWTYARRRDRLISSLCGPRQAQTAHDSGVDAPARPAALTLGGLEPDPLVSVIVSNYNYARFLPAAIDSALRQTHGRLEVIVVDDGSTDDSAAVLERLRQSDARLVVLRQDNAGQASAWNRAYRHARGAIVCFLDPDDVFLPTKMQRVIAAFAASPSAVLAYHRWEPTTADGRVAGAAFPRTLEAGDLFGVAIARGGLGGNSITSVISLRREFADAVFPLPEAFSTGFGDGYLQATAQFLGDIVAIDEVLTRYRIHGDNDSGSLQPTATGIGRQAAGRRLVHEHLRAFVAQRFGADLAERLDLDDDAGYLEHLAAHHLLTRRTRTDRIPAGDRDLDPVSILRGLPATRRRHLWRVLFWLPPHLARAVFALWWGHAPWKRTARALGRLFGLS